MIGSTRRSRPRRARKALALTLAGSLFLAACGDDEGGDGGVDDGSEDADAEDPADEGEAQEEVALEYAHALASGHPYHECGVSTLPDLVEEADVGLSITTFADGSAYGSTAEQLDALVAGELAMTLGAPGQISAWDERLSVLDALFLFDDSEQLEQVLAGEVGQELWDGLLEESGIRMLGLGLYGTRHLTSNVPVTHPDDLAGQKLRAVEGTLYTTNAEIMGGDPTPIAFPELYVALQQGVADAQENPIAAIEASGFHEVQDYLSLTGHLVQYFPTVISDEIWQTLSPEQQDALQSAIDTALDAVYDCQVAADEEILEEWRGEDSPIEVIEAEDIDIDAFRQRAEETYPGPMADDWGDLYDRLLEEVETLRG